MSKYVKEIKSVDFEDVVINGGRVIVDFYSDECPPCEALASKYEDLAKIYGQHVTFVKIFRQQNKDLALELGVTGSPTVLFYNNGKISKNRFSGGVKRSDIIKNIHEMLTGAEIKEIEKNIVKKETKCEVLILGGGPGGLTAGIYAAQAKMDTILVDPLLPGGQVNLTHEVSNYPGFIEPQKGFMLMHYMSEQAKGAGVKYKVAVDIDKVDLVKKEIVIDGVETIKANKIIISTGSSPRPLGIEGEEKYKGNGISYCATCDAKYFQDRDVIVIGGGNSAVEESLFISKFAKTITVIHQFDKLTANKQAQEKLISDPKVNIMYECEPREFIKTDDGKMQVNIENLKTKKIQNITADGIFVFVGTQANTDLLSEKLEKDQYGYIKTDEDRKTNINDVYAVGDVISKKIRQITTAVSDGTIAAVNISSQI